jgi:hypothetical protein
MSSMSTDYTVSTLSDNIITISGGSDSYLIGDIGDISLTSNDITFNFPEEWVDSFPEWDRIQQMCNEYPGLKIAFEKFKTTYKLVKDDYDTPKDNRHSS